MYILYRLLTILFLPLVIYSCEEPSVEEVSSFCYRDWETIKKDCVLTVLAENSPASYFIYRGRNMGYEYELLHELTKDYDVRLEVKMVNDLDEMLEMLYRCEGDLLACNLSPTDNRNKYLTFSEPHYTTKHVLVQRVWDEKDSLSLHFVDNINDLRGRKVHIWKHSSYYDNLVALNEDQSLDLTIIPLEGELSTDEIIRMVSDNEIDYTVVDENVAQMSLYYYPNIDYSLALSETQDICFAFRKDSDSLIAKVNNWLLSNDNRSTIGEVRRKYFKRKSLVQKGKQDFSSLVGNSISEYDSIIRFHTDSTIWDWRLISAIIYQESKFETWKVSWAGAFGLFQFMPGTARGYGISKSSSAEAQIQAGIKKLTKNFNEWYEEIPDTIEALKFTLANFNAGRSHIDDARVLCDKYELDKNVWDENVNKMMLNLRHPQYYKDEDVKYGYCRGTETYEYVIEVMQRYREYCAAFPDTTISYPYSLEFH